MWQFGQLAIWDHLQNNIFEFLVHGWFKWLYLVNILLLQRKNKVLEGCLYHKKDYYLTNYFGSGMAEVDKHRVKISMLAEHPFIFSNNEPDVAWSSIVLVQLLVKNIVYSLYI